MPASPRVQAQSTLGHLELGFRARLQRRSPRPGRDGRYFRQTVTSSMTYKSPPDAVKESTVVAPTMSPFHPGRDVLGGKVSC